MNEKKNTLVKIGVLSSGRGIIFEAIIRAIKEGILKDKTTVEVLICNKAKELCMKKAKKHNIPFVLIESDKHIGTREEFDKKMLDVFDNYECELIVLVGYMQLVSKMFINHFSGNILNFHPSLLPSFKGMHAVKDALAYGVKVSGATVHFVDSEIDHGPIIIQKFVPVCDTDTWETIGLKILICGCEIVPKAIELFSDKRLCVEGRIVKVHDKGNSF